MRERRGVGEMRMIEDDRFEISILSTCQVLLSGSGVNLYTQKFWVDSVE
jgi:hypothetical protein